MSMSGSSEAVLARYRRASDYINGLSEGSPTPRPDATPAEIRARMIQRVDRMRRFLDFAGNPQDQFHSVHVGGTSGKGSTATFIAAILEASGYRTGLHVSPYIQVETEKLVIDGRLLSADRFAGYVDELAELLGRWYAAGGERIGYGQSWVALSYLALAREKVDFGVIEVGAGGRFDLTNVLNPDVSVITSIGLDHVRTLGGTIPEIAWHKAGIIKPGRPVVTTVTQPEALAVIEAEAELQHAPLTIISAGRDFEIVSTSVDGTAMLDKRTNHVFKTGLGGVFQAPNAAAAINAVRALPEVPGGKADQASIACGLGKARFAGRIEIVQESPRVILDGAHNPAKMGSLAESMQRLSRPRRRILIFGSVESHDFSSTARVAATIADEIIVTSPALDWRSNADPNQLAEVFQQTTDKLVTAVDDPFDALALALSRAEEADEVLVTGSLYLIGKLRDHWYPADQIILQQTMWPNSDRQG